ncbi:hypothetical protein VNO80_28345 [Phaseolus coccineus]|uniref:Uncharacterized protein n=1 Tax=Phaseolus coccineus TaxID=3886 RepID=A0AAN9QHG3_PHACN
MLKAMLLILFFAIYIFPLLRSYLLVILSDKLGMKDISEAPEFRGKFCQCGLSGVLGAGIKAVVHWGSHKPDNCKATEHKAKRTRAWEMFICRYGRK